MYSQKSRSNVALLQFHNHVLFWSDFLLLSLDYDTSYTNTYTHKAAHSKYHHHHNYYLYQYYFKNRDDYLSSLLNSIH